MMRSSTNKNKTSTTATPDDDIRVTGKRGGVLGSLLFPPKPEKEPTYGHVDIQGRDPVDFGEAKRLEEEAAKKSAPRSSPSTNTTSKNGPDSSSSCNNNNNNKSSSVPPPKTRNSSNNNNNTKNKNDKNGKTNSATDEYFSANKARSNPSSPLAGRNPRDFDGADPYANNNHNKNTTNDDPLAGRNPRDFDGADPYGKNNTHQNHPSSSKNASSAGGNPLEGRNPQDFDASDPYANNNKSKGVNSKSGGEDPLAGRNPQDFDGSDPYSNKKNASKEDPLAGRNPVDFGHAPSCRSLNSDSDHVPRVVPTTGCHHCPYCHRKMTPEDPVKDDDGTHTTTSVDTMEEQDGDAKNNHGSSSYLDPQPGHEPETVDLQHVETVQREIPRDVPEWTKTKLRPTPPKNTRPAPPKTKEKFSLQTFHQPRVAVPS